jgi:hypothetical protein
VGRLAVRLMLRPSARARLLDKYRGLRGLLVAHDAVLVVKVGKLTAGRRVAGQRGDYRDRLLAQPQVHADRLARRSRITPDSEEIVDEL